MPEQLVAVQPPERLSQTLASYLDSCPRAAYLSLLYDGGAPSLDLDRGSALHLFSEEHDRLLIEHGEASLFAPQPGEDPLKAAEQVANDTKGMVDGILAEHPELVVSATQAERVRQMAYHLAIGFDIPEPATSIVGLEQKFVLDLDCGWTLSGKVDRIWKPDEWSFGIDDLKTSLHVPTEEQFEDSFQTRCYGLLAVFGVPVEKRPCSVCSGQGCPGCRGKGTYEVRLDPLGDGVQKVRLREIYPRARPKQLEDGRLQLVQRGPLQLTRMDLLEFKMDVERAALRLERGLAEGDWPARRGSHCTRCPAKSQCPIPAEQREIAVIDSVQAAAAALEQREAHKAEADRLWEEIKAFSAASGKPVPAGRDEVYEFDTSHERSLRRAGRSSDWDGLEQAIENAVKHGEVFDVRKWVQEKPVTRFKRKRVSAGEVEALLSEQGGERAGE